MAKKPAENTAYQKLKQDIRSGQLGSCYVFYGEEGYLREHYFGQMKRKLLDGPAEEFNYHKFTRETLDWDQVADAVEAMPMMAERTLVEIDDVDLYREPEAAREKLIAILSDLPDYCCLVFQFDTVEYAPDRRLKKLHAALEQRAQVVEFRKQSAADLRAWVRRQAVRGGKDIDNATSDYLAFLTDHSLNALQSELQKLTAYAQGPLITRQDIDAVVEPTLTAGSFDISNAIVDGAYERALSKLRDLLAMQQDPLLLLGGISRQMRQLQYARVLLENGKDSGALARMCGMGEYPARLTMAAARKLSARFCTRAVLLCLEADRRMKSSAETPERILELLLVRLAQEAKV